MNLFSYMSCLSVFILSMLCSVILTAQQQQYFGNERSYGTNGQNSAQFNAGQIPNNMILSGGISSGSSSKHHKDQAVRQIPMQKLAPERRERVANVLDKTSVYRRLPVTTINTDPDLYLFLVRYPESILNIWQIMGVTQMTADRIEPFKLSFDDGVGTQGNVELIYGTPNTNIYYGEGVYEGPLLFRKVTGQCVLVLETQYHRDDKGQPQTTSTLDVFLKIDHLAAGLIAKTVHPLVGSTADHNFSESLKFVEKLSSTTVENGHGVKGLAQRLTRIHPDVRNRFEEIVDIVSQRAAANDHNSTSEERGYPARPTSYQQRR